MGTIKKAPDFDKKEKKLLKSLWDMSVINSKSAIFLGLTNLMMEAGDYKKARIYLQYAAGCFDKEYGTVWKGNKQSSAVPSQGKTYLIRQQHRDNRAERLKYKQG